MARAAWRPGLLALLLGALPARAIAQMPAAMGQTPARNCAATVRPTGNLAPWSQPMALPAAGDASHLATTRIEIGQAVLVALLPTSQVHYALMPEKPGGPVGYGGLLGLRIRQPGTYRIASGSSAWLDLVSHGKAATSIAHGHGPACTGIHKMVDFQLQPGNYTLQISANGEPQTTILAVRLT